MILATLQIEINNKLHSKYHHNIHIQNSFELKNLNIPSQNWLNQKVFILDKDTNIWIGAVMYYSQKLNKHFIVYDDYCLTEWKNINQYEYIDWSDDEKRKI